MHYLSPHIHTPRIDRHMTHPIVKHGSRYRSRSPITHRRSDNRSTPLYIEYKNLLSRDRSRSPIKKGESQDMKNNKRGEKSEIENGNIPSCSLCNGEGGRKHDINCTRTVYACTVCGKNFPSRYKLSHHKMHTHQSTKDHQSKEELRQAKRLKLERGKWRWSKE